MGWTVRGSKPDGGREFPHPSRPALGPIQPPIQWVPGRFPGGKAAGAWRWPPTPILRRGWRKSRAMPLLPPGPSWPVLGWTLPLLCLTWQMTQLSCINNSFAFRLQIRITYERTERGLQLCTLLVVLNAGLPHFPSLVATSRKVAGSIPSWITGIFLALILPAAPWPWGRLSL